MKGLNLLDVLQGAIFDKKLHQDIPMNQAWDDEIRSVSKDKIREIARCFNKPLKQIKHIGSGCIGSAFLLSPRRVLKVTTSRREFKGATKLIGKNHKNIYKVHKTFEAGGKYFIITDRYYKVTKAQENILDMLTYNTFTMGYKSNGWKRVRNQFLQAYDTHVEYNGHYKGGSSEAVRKLIEYGVKNMVEELQRSRIKAGDFHEGNVMRKKNGQLVIIDLYF
jgi:hypothetical protein